MVKLAILSIVLSIDEVLLSKFNKVSKDSPIL
jgi:hypothetical protein